MKCRVGIFTLAWLITCPSVLQADEGPHIYAPYAQDQRLVDAQPMVNGERHIVIVTCSYNNAEYYKWNLDSIFSQNYSNFHLIYVDDCSPDGTFELVKTYIIEHGWQDRVILIQNTDRAKALANIYRAVHLCKPTDIIAILDGDDRFAHQDVLQRVNSFYANPLIWLTYGQYREYPSGIYGFCHAYPQQIIDNNGFRHYPDGPSHLRTFYAGLFHKIAVADLKFQGEFFSMTYDLAIMFPMLEMARHHFTFVPEVLVDYNAINPLNDHKISKQLQRKFDLIIRSRSRYNEIESPF